MCELGVCDSALTFTGAHPLRCTALALVRSQRGTWIELFACGFCVLLQTQAGLTSAPSAKLSEVILSCLWPRVLSSWPADALLAAQLTAKPNQSLAPHHSCCHGRTDRHVSTSTDVHLAACWAVLQKPTLAG